MLQLRMQGALLSLAGLPAKRFPYEERPVSLVNPLIN